MIDIRTVPQKRLLLCRATRRPGTSDDWLKEVRMCLICEEKFLPIASIQFACEKCADIYGVNTAASFNTMLKLSMHKKVQCCMSCGKEPEDVKGSAYCKACLMKRKELGASNVPFPCGASILGCKNFLIQANYVFCKECREVLLQHFCWACGNLLVPPASKYYKYDDNFYCSKVCYVKRKLKSTSEELISGKKKLLDEQEELLIVKQKLSMLGKEPFDVTSFLSSFVLGKIKQINGNVTINDILKIVNDYVECVADDYREEGRDQLRSEIEEKNEELKRIKDEQIKKIFRILQLVTKLTPCIRSGKIPDSEDHIIPREFKKDYGDWIENSLVNKLVLEKYAHNEVQIVKDNYIKERLSKGEKPTIQELVYYTYFGFPGEDFDSINNTRIENIKSTLTENGFSKSDIDASSYAPVINNMIADKVKKYHKTVEKRIWFMAF